MASKLQTVANSMRRALANARDEFVVAEPERGLYLQLQKGADADTLLLFLRREAVYPTTIEVLKWAEAFGVPDGTDNMRRRSWASTHPKTQRPLLWCAVTLTWREIPESTCATTA